MAEQWSPKPRVEGSNPSAPAIIKRKLSIEFLFNRGFFFFVQESNVKISMKIPKLTKKAIRAGANIRLADEAQLAHMKKAGAREVTVSGTILFREDATVSDVLEEVFHFWQNHKGKYSEYGSIEREILCEIEAKEDLLSVTEKYSIPELEQRETRTWLKIYQKRMRDRKRRGDWREPD